MPAGCDVATCAMHDSQSWIDFFIVDSCLATGVKAVQAWGQWAAHPHRPVCLRFQDNLADRKYRCIAEPPPCMIAHPIAPLLE
eukprot:10713769-Prorocentrum_lima.AAC.1